MSELLDSESLARRMPVWEVSRLHLRPDGSFYARPLGKWRAWSRDDAIEKAAFAVRCLAVLTARKVPAR